MKIELTKIEGKTVGYALVAETQEDKLILGSIRNMEFFGLNGTALSYNGVEAEETEEGSFALKLHYIQKKHHPSFKEKYHE